MLWFAVRLHYVAAASSDAFLFFFFLLCVICFVCTVFFFLFIDCCVADDLNTPPYESDQRGTVHVTSVPLSTSVFFAPSSCYDFWSLGLLILFVTSLRFLFYTCLVFFSERFRFVLPLDNDHYWVRATWGLDIKSVKSIISTDPASPLRKRPTQTCRSREKCPSEIDLFRC